MKGTLSHKKKLLDMHVKLLKNLIKKGMYLSYSLFGNKFPRNIGLGCSINRHTNFIGVLKGINIGDSVKIERFSTLECNDDRSRIYIGNRTIIKSFAIISTQPGGSIKIGENCSVNPYCVLYGHGGLTIGDNVRIATHTVIVPANHNYNVPDKLISQQDLTRKGIVIGDDVWIGAGVRILDGCNIGKGAVIGAGAVVTTNVPEYTVYVGTPARFLKKRY